MEIQRTQGVVLASSLSGEADRVARVFTRDYGKRSFVFKGIRKSKKRSLAAAEPGSVVELVYYYHEERDFFIVNECAALKTHYSIRDDLAKILHLYLALEVVEKTTGFNDPNERIYDLLAAGIDALAGTPHIRQFTAFFLIRLLKIHGILPHFSRCRQCGSEEFTRFRLESADLMPVCARCLGVRGEGAGLFGPDTRAFIGSAVKSRFSSIDHARHAEDQMRMLVFSLCLFIEGYYHIELKSKRMALSGEGARQS